MVFRMGSWIEEVVARYYQKKGFFVIKNYLFYVSREESGKKAGGWSDIDVLAYKDHELHIVQCKPFLGQEKHEKVINDITRWFNLAEKHVKEDPKIGHLASKSTIRRVLVLHTLQPKSAVNKIRERGIEVIALHKIIAELIKIIREEVRQYAREGTGRIGKEVDVLLAFIRELILRDIINQRKVEELTKMDPK